jgi:hypothetical protein
MKKKRVLSAIKERKGTTSIKFTKDTKELRKRISILIFIIILVGNITLALYSSYIFYSIFQLTIIPENLEQTQPDNETINIEGSITIESIIDITDFVLNLSLITDENLTIIEEFYEKDKIPSGERTELTFGFEISYVDIDLFISLNNTDYIIFDIFVSLNYGGYIISLELQIKQDIEDFF